MQFNRDVLLLLEIIVTCFWKNVQTVQPPKEQTITKYPHAGFGSSSNLLDKSLESSKGKAREHIFLCDYLFNSCHYLNLMKQLMAEENEHELSVLIEHNDSKIFFFSGQTLEFINIAFNMGATIFFDQFWFLYMYAECLRSLVMKKTSVDKIKKSPVILLDHDVVYRTLTEFTKKNCKTKNVYNDQYIGSKYEKILKKLRKSPFQTRVWCSIKKKKTTKHYVDELKSLIDKRINKLSTSMTVKSYRKYIIFSQLRLYAIMGSDNIMKSLLNDLAKVSDWKRVFESIVRTCYNNKNFEFNSVQLLVKDITGCQDIFTNIIKYIILLCTWNHLNEVVAINSEDMIEQYNNEMSKNCYEVISFFQLKEVDGELKCISDLFKASPITFLDQQNIIKNKTKVMGLLEDVKSKISVFEMEKLPVTSLEDRVEQKNNNMTSGMNNLNKFVGFIKTNIKYTHFNVTNMFSRFSKNIHTYYL